MPKANRPWYAGNSGLFICPATIRQFRNVFQVRRTSILGSRKASTALRFSCKRVHVKWKLGTIPSRAKMYLCFAVLHFSNRFSVRRFIGLWIFQATPTHQTWQSLYVLKYSIDSDITINSTANPRHKSFAVEVRGYGARMTGHQKGSVSTRVAPDSCPGQGSDRYPATSVLMQWKQPVSYHNLVIRAVHDADPTR